MSYQQFLQSLSEPYPAIDLEVALRAMWFDANQRPESAIRAAEFDKGHYCQRVRAYLYRKAGDENNAQLLYWRSGTKPWSGSSESEWQDIVQSIIAERIVASAYR